MDHLATAGTLLNQKFTPAAIAGEKGIDNLAALIRSYFAMNGHHMQFNVIDRQTLIEAQKNPEEYKELIVRVAGYSDYSVTWTNRFRTKSLREPSRALEAVAAVNCSQPFDNSKSLHCIILIPSMKMI